MCVSAEASFGLTGLLLPVGLYCMSVAAHRDRSALPLAAVPLFFGIQQFCEGVVWVGIGRENVALTHSAAMAYLFFAMLLWLVWIPLCALCLESSRKIKSLLALDGLLGLVGGMALYLPILLNPKLLVVTVEQHSIRYDFVLSPGMEVISPLVWHLAYLAIVTWPLLIVSQERKGLLAFSIALVISATMSHAWFWYAFASVWCFFAAVLSLMLVYAFHRLPWHGPNSPEASMMSAP